MFEVTVTKRKGTMSDANSTAQPMQRALDQFGTLIDGLPKPALIAITVLGFIVAWPLALLFLGFLFWSGRMGCSKRSRSRGWHRSRHDRRSTGNAAFDDYRDATLARLEEEQKEFEQFLDQLRRAKDQAEFDQFMAKRNEGPNPETPPAA